MLRYCHLITYFVLGLNIDKDTGTSQKRKVEIKRKVERVTIKNIVYPRYKQRLFVALYWGPGDTQRHDYDQLERAGLPPTQDPEDERKYHWAFMTGPAVEDRDKAVPGRRYAVKLDTYSMRWKLDGGPIMNIKNTGPTMLCRVMIGKIVKEHEAVQTILGTPVGEDLPTYRNKRWLLDVYAALDHQKGTVMSQSSVLNPVFVENRCKWFVELVTHGRVLDVEQDNQFNLPAWDSIFNYYIWSDKWGTGPPVNQVTAVRDLVTGVVTEPVIVGWSGPAELDGANERAELGDVAGPAPPRQHHAAELGDVAGPAPPGRHHALDLIQEEENDQEQRLHEGSSGQV
ncbi:hypothetical protein GE09DRAFT_1220611 [Coniochaeta sp. 2T2.1]|nr:hypothetical protein GE09DRAFT_1220611 [Coniochaeta sp. 2T2.1]